MNNKHQLKKNFPRNLLLKFNDNNCRFYFVYNGCLKKKNFKSM